MLEVDKLYKDLKLIIRNSLRISSLAGASCIFWEWFDDQMVVIGICLVGET